MNLPASVSSFVTSTCQRYRSISLQAINIKMTCLSVLSKASRHQLFSHIFPLQALNTSSLIFYPTSLVPISLFPQKKLFFPFYFWLLFLSKDARTLFFTPPWLHLHRSGSDGLRDVTWACEGCKQQRPLRPPGPPPLVAGPTMGLPVPLSQRGPPPSFPSEADPGPARHFQGKAVFKEHLILNYHLHTIPSLTNISKPPKSKRCGHQSCL